VKHIKLFDTFINESEIRVKDLSDGFKEKLRKLKFKNEDTAGLTAYSDEIIPESVWCRELAGESAITVCLDGEENKLICSLDFVDGYAGVTVTGEENAAKMLDCIEDFEEASKSYKNKEHDADKTGAVIAAAMKKAGLDAGFWCNSSKLRTAVEAGL
jgi:hypothetical protein